MIKSLGDEEDLFNLRAEFPETQLNVQQDESKASERDGEQRPASDGGSGGCRTIHSSWNSPSLRVCEQASATVSLFAIAVVSYGHFESDSFIGGPI